MTPLARLLSLRVELRDEAAAAEVTPEALAAYAEGHGWHLASENAERRVYQKGAGEIHIPREAGWPGYGRRVLAELKELAAVEDRSTLAIWAELVGCREEASPGRFTGCFTGDPADTRPSERPSQASLPGFDDGKPRRHTQHRFGGFDRRLFPAGPLAPEATVELVVRACPHCSCLHRVGSTGPRQGAQDLYSSDGVTWSTTSPPCHPKQEKR